MEWIGLDLDGMEWIETVYIMSPLVSMIYLFFYWKTYNIH